MKGYITVVGVNDGCKRLDKATGYGTLTNKYHKNYLLEFKNEEFFLEILDFIVCDNFIEFSAWIGDKDHNYGRFAFQLEPEIKKGED